MNGLDILFNWSIFLKKKEEKVGKIFFCLYGRNKTNGTRRKTQDARNVIKG